MQYLFRNELLVNYLNRFKINLRREIESCKPDYLLNVNEDDYYSYLIPKYVLAVPILRENEIHISEKKELERERGRPTVYNPSMLSGKLLVKISIPFVGDRHLFKCRPSSYTPNPPLGNLGESEIRFHYEIADRDPNSIKRRYTKDIEEIKKYLQWLEKDLNSHNDWIKNNARKFISERKKDLLRDQVFLESIGLPIKRSENIPETYSIPTVRKKIEITRPSIKRDLKRPEPILPEVEYEYILETISHMSLAMERSPKTFSKLRETEIRDFFVIILNSHYEGQATGETFNYKGKTDILIRVEDRNVFIAECKFWNGEKHFVSTIDQILGYASWRDTKTAIFLFNRNQNFSNVLSRIGDVVKSHRFYKRRCVLRNEKLTAETVFSYVFQHPTDADRELFLAILAFDISNE